VIPSRLFRLAASLATVLCAFAGASAQVRIQSIDAPVNAPALGGLVSAPSIPAAAISALGAAPLPAAPSIHATPAAVAAPAALPAAAAAGPEAPRPAAASVEAAAAPVDEGAKGGRAVFDGGVSDPRRAVQLETVNRFWDERNLTVTRLPVVVGELTGKTEFSRVLRQNPRVQSMIIRKPGGGLRLPAGLKQFQEAVAAAFAYEKKINPDFERYYAYLTVTQGIVESGKSQKRPNAHTDGYPRRPEDRGEVDRMYLVSDVLPTEYFDQPFPVPTAHDFAAIHATFENATDPAKIVVHPDYNITMMDSYTVHRSQKSDRPEFRTFVQIHFASRLYAMAHNTPNPLFAGAEANPAFDKLRDYWRDYESRYRAAAANGPVVGDPRAFFAEAFELGKLWWTKTLWGHRMSLDAAEASARRTVRESFEPRAPGSARAFDAFAARVRAADNPESPYKKRTRLYDALLAASLLPPGEVAPYFDGLMNAESVQADREFRLSRQPAVVASFQEQVDAILSAKLAANKDYNAAGVLLTGSYAHGSAKESSDLDILVLTHDGTGRDAADFMAELESRRAAYGWPDWKDWRRYPVQNILGASDEKTMQFVREQQVLVVTPDAALRRRLTAEAGSSPSWNASPLETLAYRLASPFRRWRLRRELERLPDEAGPAAKDAASEVRDPRYAMLIREAPEKIFIGANSPESRIEALLAPVRTGSPYLYGHMKRVGLLAGLLAKEMGLTQEDVERAVWAASFHDIGKMDPALLAMVDTPRETELEPRKLLAQHPVLGAERLQTMPGLPEAVRDGVVEAARSHHERLDGSGYPFGIAGEKIPLLTRITAVADLADAIQGVRSYSPGNDFKTAVENLESRSAGLDPLVLQALRRLYAAAPAAASESAALWNGGIPDSQARRLLNKAHWETAKFFFTARVRLLREMIEQQKAQAAGKALAVDDLEAMWLDWRVSGYSGRVTTAGFEVADRASMRADALKFFDRHWGRDEASRAAFRRYMDRVDATVPLSRPSNYRKYAFASPFDLANLTRAEVPARLDSLLNGEHAAEIARHREQRQELVLASFKTAALASIREVNAGLPEGKKIVAVIMLGSYSVRQSNPKSDIDYQLMTQDGGAAPIKPFSEALARNWTENRLDKIEAFEFALPPSRAVIVESFKEGYQIVSPDPAAVRALSKEDFAPDPPTSWSLLRGRLFTEFYRAWSWSYLRLADLADTLKHPARGAGSRSPLVAVRSQVPSELDAFYQELPGGALRRLADDPILASLRAADIHLWTIRHGESESNRARLLTGSGTNAPLTSELDEKGLSGELQARSAALRMYENLGGDGWARKVLAGEEKSVVILFSPLRRAEQTANALKTLLDDKRKEIGSDGPRLYESQAVQDLREMGYGDLDGTTIDDAKNLPWWPAWDGVTGLGRDFLRRFPSGESRFDVLLRQRSVLLWIAEKFPGRTVVTFAHLETVTAQNAILGRLATDPNDGSLKAAPVENAQPIELLRP
jgi:putative nucleotidyltransferase with HDIG domain